jgi:hypothetical protein
VRCAQRRRLSTRTWPTSAEGWRGDRCGRGVHDSTWILGTEEWKGLVACGSLGCSGISAAESGSERLFGALLFGSCASNISYGDDSHDARLSVVSCSIHTGTRGCGVPCFVVHSGRRVLVKAVQDTPLQTTVCSHRAAAVRNVPQAQGARSVVHL